MAETEQKTPESATLNNDELPRAVTKEPDGSNHEASADEYPHGLRLFLLVGASIMAVFLVSLDLAIIGIALPKITDEFGGIYDVAWYGAVYFMTYGGMAAAWGKAFKYFDLKHAFITSILIFEIGSLICGLAPNSKSLIAGRAIAGLGAAGMVVGGTSIVAFSAEPKFRPVLMGFVGLTYSLASVLGPLLGGALTEKVTWRWCFYINLPIGGLAAVVVIFLFHTPSAAEHIRAPLKERLLQLDPVGVALAMGSIICFIQGLQYAGSSRPWNDSQVIGLLVGFGVISIVLALWEIYQEGHAMLIPRLLKKRAVWSLFIYQFSFVGVLFILMYYLPVYFQVIRGAGPIESGVDSLPFVISVGIFAIIGGVVVSKTGHAAPPMLAGATVATVGTGLIYSLDLDTPIKKWIGYQILTGSAIAFSVQDALNIAQANVEQEDIAAVVACVYFFQTLGGAFSIAAGQAAFVNQLIAKLEFSAPTVDPAQVIATGATQLRDVFTPEELPGIIQAYLCGLRAVWAVGIGFSGVACLSTAIIPWSRLPTHKPVAASSKESAA
ncbi:MFS gliotoxin efflux transporter glia [Hypomontagnella monticulosa]|nr:MFS gliotoxin efflux transporter glia [Hypomontagnella monticulosa]